MAGRCAGATARTGRRSLGERRRRAHTPDSSNKKIFLGKKEKNQKHTETPTEARRIEQIVPNKKRQETDPRIAARARAATMPRVSLSFSFFFPISAQLGIFIKKGSGKKRKWRSFFWGVALRPIQKGGRVSEIGVCAHPLGFGRHQRPNKHTDGEKGH